MTRKTAISCGCKGAVTSLVLMALLWFAKDMLRIGVLMWTFNVVNYPILALIRWVATNLLYGERVMPVVLPLTIIYWVLLGFVGGILVKFAKDLWQHKAPCQGSAD